ncbi:hypothetical protein [Sphingobacterium chuzhouense]|uniref:Tetratricopeptide repeat n=1 Tax=Sphingobacterium chuzhouense TaxID=1742264 RepID=A0ABR7XTB4_9SPHI|nr:hypothetical protein [Sphingobacterium chuzhouense]MBD1422413.1 hypothetical protein [Sphingobacterium chuzhouense]
MQKQCTRTIERSKRYFHNNTGKDVLITENFNFFKMFEGIDGNQTKQAYEYYRKGEKLFTIGDYEHAIMEYEKAKINEIDPKRYGGLFYNDLIIHLGISYIATEQKEKACNTFRLIGDETNFRVRNYLKFFCL